MLGTLEGLTKLKKRRLRVVCASATDEARAKMKYKILGDENVRQLKRENRRAAKLIVGYMDNVRARQKVFA